MKITEYANAKINLYLDILSRFPDGFHEIRTVMHSLDLCDVLEMDCRRAEHTELSLSVTGGDPIPSDENNLICRVVLAYLRKAAITATVRVRLHKRIPVGAGLGGGSSDAAATLRGMNRAFGSLSEEELLALASELGSDVSYCLRGGTVLCGGRGEQMEPISTPLAIHAVVAIGSDRVSTPAAYRALDERYSFFDGSVKTDGDGFDRFMDAIKRGALPTELYNVFESVTLPLCPEVGILKSSLESLGATHTLMSGSGPAVFGIFADEKTARSAASKLSDDGFFAQYCASV